MKIYAVKVMKKYIGQYKDLKIAILNRNLFLMNQEIENTIKLKIIEKDKEYSCSVASKTLLPIEDCIAEYKKYLEWKIN